MAGRHFLQIPGPSAVPDRILRAIDHQVIDHRGPDFAVLGLKCLEGMKRIFRTEGDVVIYPASGTGAWEAALVNTMSPGDRVLMYETGHFAALWSKLAGRIGSGCAGDRERLAGRCRRRTRSTRRCARMPGTRSGRSASCTTRPRPVPPAGSPRSARPSTTPGTRRS